MTTVIDICVLSRGVGGTERRFARAVPQLAVRGVNVRYVCNASLVPTLAGTAVVESGRLSAMSGMGPVNEMVISAAAVLTAAARGHLIHACLNAIIVAALAPPGSRTVVSVTAARPHLIGVSGWKERLFWRGVRRARIVDCLNPEMADAITRRGVPSRRVLVGPGSFTDPHHYRPSEKEPLVSFVGRLVDQKQPLLFVEAAELVARALPDVRFTILGSGPLEGRVRRRVKELGLQDRFSIEAGYDSSDLLGRSIVFASLQTDENYPSQSLLEAMACGNAVVATDVGRTADVVDEGVGIRVPPEPGAVARAMVRLLERPDDALRAGITARQVVEDRFSVGPYIAYLMELYEAAAASS